MDLISLGLGLGSAVLGGIGGQSQADAQNEAIENQYEYDKDAWHYGKKTIKADYQHNKSSGGWISAMIKESVSGKIKPIYRIGNIT
jgi:hypothetical protein